jgi:aminoglycoside 3-N-acetyltransferase
VNLVERLSGVTKRFLTEERHVAIRAAYFKLRVQAYPLMGLIYGTFNADDLRKHLQQTIDPDFEILMVHSSVNHMLPMYKGTPLDLVKMLLDFCGSDRTLVMPAFYFGNPKYGGAFGTFRAQPVFDLKRTPSQMGLVTELFRRMPGTIQSRHPVYRVTALGPHARALVAGHENASDPAGLSSPFEYMAKSRTRIIGIGKTFQVLTQAHHVEGLLGDAFPVPNIPTSNLAPIEISVLDGAQAIPVKILSADKAWKFDIWRLRRIMTAERLKTWNFHHVPMFSARADHVTDDLVAAARKGITLYIKPK